MPVLETISAASKPESIIENIAPGRDGCFKELISAPGILRFKRVARCVQFLIQFRQTLQSLLSDRNDRCKNIGHGSAFSDPLKQSCVVHIVLHTFLFARISIKEDMENRPIIPPRGQRWRHQADFSKIKSTIMATNKILNIRKAVLLTDADI